MGLVYADIELINLADETLFEDGYLPQEKGVQMLLYYQIMKNHYQAPCH